MYKYALIILSICAVSFSQTTIPPPAEIANFTSKTFPDDTVYKDKSIEASSLYTPQISSNQNVGDFDGDGSEEIYITWKRNLLINTTLVSSGDPFTNVDNRNQSCLYSVKKSAYLINGPFVTQMWSINDWPSSVITGDFTGDGNVDFLIGNKVYSTSTPIVKKK